VADHQETVSNQFAVSGGDKFVGIEFGASPNGSPLLSDALALLDCTLHAEYEGGDHSIAASRVHALDAAPGSRPLLFHRGRYTRAAEH
jgi:3-hydroxy-9,10-secoandrosta-1,3,5(10)-triene-9,17-dione monooxygenase reductase component